MQKSEKSLKKQNISDSLKYLKEVFNNKDYSREESFMYSPFDKRALITTIQALKKLKISKTRLIILIGIGGSSLGAKAVFRALERNSNTPNLLFLETLSTEKIKEIGKELGRGKWEEKEVTVFLISKSGNTLEALTNYSLLTQRYPFIKQRTCVITQKESTLDKFAEKERMPTLYIPQNIGGRFSVFSAVGIAPLITAKVNILEFLSGAQKAVLEILREQNKDFFRSIQELSTTFNKGKNIRVLFAFNPNLENLGKWYSQLLAESLGKKGKGITPLTAIGTTDMHSLGQLFLGGPKDKTFEFLYVREKEDFKIERIPFKNDLVKIIKGKTVVEIKEAIYKGVLKDFKKNKIDYTEFIFRKEKMEEDLGRYMMLKMLEIYLLGKEVGINPFGQPNVEGYKKNSIKILKRL